MFARIKNGKGKASTSGPAKSNSGANNSASSRIATPDGVASQITDSEYNIRCKEILEMYRYLRELG